MIQGRDRDDKAEHLVPLAQQHASSLPIIARSSSQEFISGYLLRRGSRSSRWPGGRGCAGRESRRLLRAPPRALDQAADDVRHDLPRRPLRFTCRAPSREHHLFDALGPTGQRAVPLRPGWRISPGSGRSWLCSSASEPSMSSRSPQDRHCGRTAARPPPGGANRARPSPGVCPPGALNRSHISSADCGSRPAVGSSSSNMRGRCSNARIRWNLRRMPREKVLSGWRTRSPRLNRSISGMVRCRTVRLSNP